MRIPLLALGLSLSTAACAQDAPSQSDARDYVRAVLGAEQQTISVGPMQVEVTLVADYFAYLVAKDFAELDLEDVSADAIPDKVKRLKSKHAKHKKKTAVLLRFYHPQHKPLGSSCDVFALQGKITKKLRIEAVGRGKQRFKVMDSQGKTRIEKLTLFQAQSSRLFRGDNVPPVIKRTYIFMPKEFRLELELKKPLHEKVKKVKVSVGGMIHFSGNCAATQIDFTRGGMADYVKGGTVEFEVPSPEPLELPSGLKELLE